MEGVLIAIALAWFLSRSQQSGQRQEPGKGGKTPTPAPPPRLHTGLDVGNALASRLTDDYAGQEDHDVSGDAGSDPLFVFNPAVIGKSYSPALATREGVEWRRLFMRHVFFPAARVEPSKDIGRAHVTAAIAVLKGFSSDPRVSSYTDSGAQQVKDATAEVMQVISNIPAGQLFTALYSEGANALIQAFKDQNVQWFNSWAPLFTPPDPASFLDPTGDGGNGELPLPPKNLWGGGDADKGQARVDADYMWGAGPAMWNVEGGKVVPTSPWHVSPGEAQGALDLAKLYPEGTPIFPRARLFSVSPALGMMVLPWRYLAGETAPIRDRINFVARVYRVIDLLSCIKYSGYTPPSTYTWTDPKLGTIRGSIFKPTPLQSAAAAPASGPIMAKAITHSTISRIIRGAT